MAISPSITLPVSVNCSINQKRSSIPESFDHSKRSLSSVFKPILRAFPLQIDVYRTITTTSAKILDAFVHSVFEFIDQPLLPSQSNFAPVEELGEGISITSNIEGQIPDGFPEGVYIRNGSNPLFGGLKSTRSVFGRSSHIWVEGEGMLHALYFKMESDDGSRSWTVSYKNRYVETETYLLEKHSKRPLFLPAVKGDSTAILSAYLLNRLRFGQVNKCLSNTNVFEHSGKLYSVAENFIPQEIDIFTLRFLRHWDFGGAWNRPFVSHPKKAPATGELVILGVDAVKPFVEIGIISADGTKLIHKVDMKYDRCSFCHDLGVTQRYNVIMDFPLIIDVNRVFRGGPLFKYDKKDFARIGVMPRYGDANSIKWFAVEPNCTIHIINSFEDGHEVVLWGCRALDTVIPEPEEGWDKFEFPHCYEWRLDMQTGKVKEKNLTGDQHFFDFPVINPYFTGIKNKYGYTQLVDTLATSAAAVPKYGGLAKLYFEEPCTEFSVREEKPQETIRVEYHKFEENVFCSGSAFVPKEGGVEEDDGWIIAFVHHEDTNISQVHIIDTKRFCGEAAAKITIPCRVPYGFHGAFMPISFWP